MPKRSTKPAKTRSAHDSYELPPEVDFSKTKFIGFGIEALEKHLGRRKMVELEPDLAKDFPTSKAVNDGLRTFRAIRRMIVQPAKRKKTA